MKYVSWDENWSPWTAAEFSKFKFGPLRSYGPKCKLHGERHMKRTGLLEYACTVSGEVFSLKELMP